MKRRQILRYARAGFLAIAGTGLAAGFQSYRAQSKDAGSLTVQWLGHTCFLLTGSGQRVLLNPFKPLGCTAGYRPPRLQVDLVMISSQLLDEGFVAGIPGNPKLLFDPGIYRVNNLQIQGIRTDHDRQGGRRFGANTTWQWTQGGIKILNLGGAAAPISVEQQILMGRPDLLRFTCRGVGQKLTHQRMPSRRFKL
ncbi:MBL fold metallo-hydrolase [Neosynechococcus sphagnicola]|uniref:MBL fold metallo-hydrolase n=1 Tax=Neosynechococcus sphagnicola TaxID=1501145 RepID=UPI000A83A38E